jgi:hypothetical protein
MQHLLTSKGNKTTPADDRKANLPMLFKDMNLNVKAVLEASERNKTFSD